MKKSNMKSKIDSEIKVPTKIMKVEYGHVVSLKRPSVFEIIQK